jgi:hypothetical protein
MEVNQKSDRKKLQFTKAGWIQLVIGGLVGGISVLGFNAFVDHIEDKTIFAMLGLRNDLLFTIADQTALSLSLGWIAICLGSAAMYWLTHLNNGLGKKMGISQMIGDGARGRAAPIPLSFFYLSYGAITALLTVTVLWKIEGYWAFLFIVAGIVLGCVMTQTAIRLWTVLDELLKGIWLDSFLLASGIALVLGMTTTLAIQLGLVSGVSGLLAIMIFNYLNILIYGVIMWQRAPDMFTNPTLEDA